MTAVHRSCSESPDSCNSAHAFYSVEEYDKTSRSPSNLCLIAHLPLRRKKKKREETAFLDFTDPQQDPLHAVTFAFL